MLFNIEHKEKQLSSKEIMDSINFAKDVLIKPFFDEEGEGKRIRYVIEMKDNFL